MERTFGRMIRRSMCLAKAQTSPKELSSSKIRKTFIDYFCEENKHLFIRSSPVFSLLDPTLAFVNAGMNQFKDVFLGLVQPACTRVANSQKCIRIMGKHNDISEVGQDGSHHTFFEMLGNWSFGDYFKEDACRMSWNLLTNVYGIPADRLYVTYFGGDETIGLSPDLEVREIWRQIGIKENHILPFGTKENFWEGGVTGPCGPCTEIHYDTVPGRTDVGHLVNGRGKEVMELWNLVFTQYNRNNNGELENLKTHFVDTGMGFERLVAVLQGKATNYETDLFMPLFEVIRKHTRHSGYTARYDGNAVDCSYRVIADHSRMLAVALADGMLPKRQIRVRTVLKKALQLSEKIFGADINLIKELTSCVADILSDSYPEVGRNLYKTHFLLESEAELIKAQKKTALEQWDTVLKKYPQLKDFNILETPQLLEGIKYVETNILNPKKSIFSGKDIWYMIDTYGIPPVVLEQLAWNLGLTCDMTSFESIKNLKKQANRESQNKKYGEMRQGNYLYLVDKLEKKKVESTLDYFKYDYRPDAAGNYIFKEQPTTIEAILRGNELLDKISLKSVQDKEEIGLILDRTSFFCEDGSQVEDRGILEIENKIFFDIKRGVKIKNFVIHFGTFRNSFSDEEVTVKDIGVLKIDQKRRLRIMRNHTALHLMHAAIRNLLPVVLEKSSIAAPEKLLSKLLVNDSISSEKNGPQEIENFVKEFILHGVSVKRKILNHSQFQALDDVVFIPGEPIVQLEIPVIEINSGFKLSKEYCTGTHLLNTSDIKDFAITAFTKDSHGVQTIQAVTGEDCLTLRKVDSEMQEEWLSFSEELNNGITLSKFPELNSKIKKLQLKVSNNNKMSYLCKSNLNTEIKNCISNMKSLERKLITEDIIKTSKATSENFVIYSIKNDLTFESSDIDNIRNCQNKPLMLLLQRNNNVEINCFVPEKFVSEIFSAQKWLLNAIGPFGGMGYHGKNENSDTCYALKERTFSESHLNQFLEFASDLAKRNIKTKPMPWHRLLPKIDFRKSKNSVWVAIGSPNENCSVNVYGMSSCDLNHGVKNNWPISRREKHKRLPFSRSEAFSHTLEVSFGMKRRNTKRQSEVLKTKTMKTK